MLALAVRPSVRDGIRIATMDIAWSMIAQTTRIVASKNAAQTHIAEYPAAHVRRFTKIGVRAMEHSSVGLRMHAKSILGSAQNFV
jgi:hypothetical protein